MNTNTPMASGSEECLIWPGFPAKFHGVEGRKRLTNVSGSPRAGGDYAIRDQAAAVLARTSDRIEDAVRARLTTMLIEARRQGVEWPEVTTKLIKRAEQSPNLPVAERSDRLLLFLGDITRAIGRNVRILSKGTGLRHSTMMELQAMSESVEDQEVEFLVKYLQGAGLVEFSKFDEGSDGGYDAVVTVAGHNRIAELSSRTDSAQAFVAMWFDDTMKDIYNKWFVPAIEGAGYRPFRIDLLDYTGKIDDEVIAQIRRSRFLVADFTHERGETVRGSVYYEAGFAHGLNIPVIFTARKGSDVHFDLSHHNRIEWEDNDLPKLCNALKNRILAVTKSAAVDSPND